MIHMPYPNNSHPIIPYAILSYPPHCRVIAENKEKTVQQCDLDGKTALDLALEEDIFTGDNMTKEVIFRLFIVMFQEVYGKYCNLGSTSLSLSLSGCLFRFIYFLLDYLSHLPSLLPFYSHAPSPHCVPSLFVGDAVEEDEGEVSIAALQDPRYATPHHTPPPHTTPQHRHTQPHPLTRMHHSLLTRTHPGSTAGRTWLK
jgi:hypothetical protein